MKFKKKLIALSLTTIMSLSFSTGVFAEDMSKTTINNQVVKYTDVSPIAEKDYVLVPFSACMEALNATDINYNDSLKSASAKIGDDTVEFIIGSNIAKINGDQFITSSPAAIIKNRTYISTDAIEKMTGLFCSYDSKTGDISFVEPTFDLMNKYLQYSNKFYDETMALKGDFTVKVTTYDDKEAIPVDIKGSISGVTNLDAINMDVEAKIDFDRLKEYIKDAKDMEEFKNFENIKFSYIFDLKEGKLYLNSNLFTTLMDTDENAWIYIDFEDLLSMSGINMNFGALMNISKESSFEKFLETYKEIKMEGFSNSEFIYPMIRMYSDQAFTEDNGKYVSNYSLMQEGVGSNIKFTALTSNGEVNGYTMDMTTSMMGVEAMKMTMSQNADFTSKVTFDINIPSLLKIESDVNLNFDKTDAIPITSPDSNSTLIDILSTIK